jgi:GNAT superfamily N-acetyltransferase
MEEGLKYRLMKSGEETEVYDLVVRVFNEFIAPHYSREGIEEFLKYARPELLLCRSEMNHFVVLGTTQGRMVGMIEVRETNHVSMFFVDKPCQKRGVGKELLREALRICLKKKPHLSKVTVNASPNSVTIYKKLGFRQERLEQVKKGIRFTPMALKLSDAKILQRRKR